MNRRGFLAGLASIPIAIAAGDLLWLPSKKSIFLPSRELFVGTTNILNPPRFAEFGGLSARSIDSSIIVQIYNESPLIAAMIGKSQ